MNTVLRTISDGLGPVAFVMGVLVVYSCFRRRNPFTFVVGFIIACYHFRTLQTSIAVLVYSGDGLVRPSGLLAWSIVGRFVEIFASSVGWLYLSGKVEFQNVLGWFLTAEEMAQPERASGDYPPEYWIRHQYEESYKGCVKALKDTMKPECLK